MAFLKCQNWLFQNAEGKKIVNIFRFFCRKLLIKISYVNAEEATYSSSGRDMKRNLYVTREK